MQKTTYILLIFFLSFTLSTFHYHKSDISNKCSYENESPDCEICYLKIINKYFSKSKTSNFISFFASIFFELPRNIELPNSCSIFFSMRAPPF